MDYEFYDVDRPGCDKPVLFYAGGDWLSAAAQKHLQEYIESGGHLICVGSYPFWDDELRTLRLPGIQDPPGILSGSPGDLWLDVLGCRTKSSFAFNYSETPGTPIVATRLAPEGQTAEELSLQMGLQTGTQYIIGYHEARGKGHLTVIGLAPSPALLLALKDQLKIHLPSRALTPQVSTALFQKGPDFYLMAVNEGNEAKVAEVVLGSGLAKTPSWQITDLVGGKEWTTNLGEGGRLIFSLPRKDGLILHLKVKGI
jgi:hypothetical protein